MDFFRQEYWSEQPFLSLGYLFNPGMELSSPALHTDSLLSEPPGTLPRSYMPQLKKKKKSQRLIFVSGNHQKYS